MTEAQSDQSDISELGELYRRTKQLEKWRRMVALTISSALCLLVVSFVMLNSIVFLSVSFLRSNDIVVTYLFDATFGLLTLLMILLILAMFVWWNRAHTHFF